MILMTKSVKDSKIVTVIINNGEEIRGWMLKGQRVHAHNVHNYFYSVLRLHVGLNSGFSVSCGLCERHLSSRADYLSIA